MQKRGMAIQLDRPRGMKLHLALESQSVQHLRDPDTEAKQTRDLSSRHR
jgi:hypothetical protein